jgi:hypothetical protein
MLKFYGIGPASVEYLLFEDFYFLDSLEIIPPQILITGVEIGKERAFTRSVSHQTRAAFGTGNRALVMGSI